jgi:hypothetical protein
MSIYEKYAKLYKRKKDLTAEIDEVKDKMSKIEEKILEKFGEEGSTSVRLGSGETLWLDHKIWASAGGDTDGLVSALKKARLGDMVKETVNRNTLSAYVREQAPSKFASPEEITKALPRGLQKAVKVTETNNVRVSKS